MKYLISLILLAFSFNTFADTREISLHTEKKKDASGKEAVHWVPGTIEVTPGEKIKIVAKHELEGGFDLHGLFIPVLKVSETVHRNKPLTTKEITVPTSLKPGEYDIGCQFHPAHVPAKLVVKEAQKK